MVENFHNIFAAKLWVCLTLYIKKSLKLYIYIAPSSGYALLKGLYMQLVTSQLRHHQLCHSCVGGVTSSHLNSPGSIQAMRLPLGTVKLFGTHIIPPLTINAGTQFTYPHRDGGLSQHLATFTQEWVLNLGPHTGRSTVLSTELSQ